MIFELADPHKEPEIPEGVTVYYRYSVTHYAPPIDEYENVIGEGRSQLNLELWPVLKKTPKGVWVGTELYNRFVLNSARKRFACPTIEEAKTSFIARKNRQIRLLAAQLRQAEHDRTLIDTEPSIQSWMLNHVKPNTGVDNQ